MSGMIDCYYCFRKAPGKKSLMLLEAHHKEYEPLHQTNRKGQICCYLTQPSHIRARRERKPAFTLCNNPRGHLSSIFLPDLEVPHLGFGDVKGTEDGLLCIFSEGRDVLEILIAKGRKAVIEQLFWIMLDGELDGEVEALRAEAHEVLDGVPEQAIQQTELSPENL